MRIRSIKPEFWRSPDIAELDHFARLLYIGLWNYVDDNGVGDDDESMIRSDLFPRDPVEIVSPFIHGALSELSLRGHVIRYEDSRSGRRYLKVVAWHHQKINRPTASSKPLPTSTDSVHAVALSEDSVNAHGGLTEGSLQEGIKGRDQGSGGGAVVSADREPRCHAHHDPIEFPTPPGCPDCKAVRLRRDTERRHADDVAASAARDAVRRKRECPLCDDHGHLLGNDHLPVEPVVRCEDRGGHVSPDAVDRRCVACSRDLDPRNPGEMCAECLFDRPHQAATLRGTA